MRRRTATVASLALALVLARAACGSDEQSADTTTTALASAPLTILVTDDDGIGAPGIDVLVNALLELDDVEVVVVAPAENQSGSSDKTTSGGASHADGMTASGVEGTAVDGFPVDTIAAAIPDGVDPFTSDCTIEPASVPADDVAAVAAG